MGINLLICDMLSVWRVLSSVVNCQAYVILGVFLALNKDKDDFAEWLKKAAGTNSTETRMCFNALKRWTEKFI